MTYPTVTRGRITVIETGITRNFMFNPPEIVDTKNVNWGQLDVPGASHPVYQYGTGGERNITFELYLDGDRGRYDRLDTQEDISVETEIKFYRSLVYPAKYNETFEAVYPHTLLFSFGQYVDNLHCIMKAPPVVRVLYWNPKLQPVRATVQITLAELSEKSQTSQDVYPVVQIGNPVMVLDPVYITAGIGKTSGGGRIRQKRASSYDGNTSVLKSKDISVSVGPVRTVQRLDPTTIQSAPTSYTSARQMNEDIDRFSGAIPEPPLFATKPQTTQLPPTTITPKRVQRLPTTTVTASKPQTLPGLNITASKVQTLPKTTFYPRTRKT